MAINESKKMSRSREGGLGRWEVGRWGRRERGDGGE